MNPRPSATVAAGVLPVFAWPSCRVEGTRRSWCASFSRSFRSNYWWMSDCRACWGCGISILGVRIYDAVPELCRPVDICCMGQGSFVMDCGALEDVLCGTRAGAILALAFFFSFISLSLNAPMCLSACASSTLMHAGRHPARLVSGNLCCLSEGKKLFIRGLQNEMSSGVFPTTRLF